MKRLDELRARREVLVARAAMHREDVAVALAGLAMPLAIADRTVAAVSYVKARPMLLAGGAAFAVVALRLPTALRLARRGFALWNRARAVRALWSTVRAAVNQGVLAGMGKSL